MQPAAISIDEGPWLCVSNFH